MDTVAALICKPGSCRSRFGDPELLSGLLLSWHTSGFVSCGHVLLDADTETHVPVLLPWARLEGRSFVAASEQVQSVRPAMKQ